MNAAPDGSNTMNSNGKKYWLDDPRNVNKIIWSLYGVCAALLLADLFYRKHTIFGWEGWFGFFGVFGFVAGMAVVLGAKELRRLIMRGEDYYDR